MLLTALLCVSLSLLAACEYAPTVRVNFYVDGAVYSVQTITDNTVKLPDPPRKGRVHVRRLVFRQQNF